MKRFQFPSFFALALALSFALSFFLRAEAKFVVPPLTGPIIDEMGVLSNQQKAALGQLLREFNSQGKAQVQIFISKSLQDLPIEQATIEITDQWQLGDKKKDNGFLFLIAPNERKMRMEVGQGLEGILPDATVKRIQAESVVPAFKLNRMGDGILQGTLRVLQVIDADFMQAQGLQPQSISSSREKKGLLDGLKPFGMFILFFILVIMRLMGGAGRGFGRNRGFGGPFIGGGGGWGGGGGGGSWSGGGGGFSGGGASSDW